jgi:hypothetical protein
MDLSMSMRPSRDGRSGTGSIHVNYTVQNEDFRALNDVDHFEMNLNMSGDEDEAEIEGGGKIHSRMRGDIELKFEGEIEMDGQEIDEAVMKMTFIFSDFEAELKQEIDGRESIYYINDEEVTEQEFRSYLEKGGPAFQGAGGMGTGQNYGSGL